MKADKKKKSMDEFLQPITPSHSTDEMKRSNSNVSNVLERPQQSSSKKPGKIKDGQMKDDK